MFRCGEVYLNIDVERVYRAVSMLKDNCAHTELQAILGAEGTVLFDLLSFTGAMTSLLPTANLSACILRTRENALDLELRQVLTSHQFSTFV